MSSSSSDPGSAPKATERQSLNGFSVGDTVQYDDEVWGTEPYMIETLYDWQPAGANISTLPYPNGGKIKLLVNLSQLRKIEPKA